MRSISVTRTIFIEASANQSLSSTLWNHALTFFAIIGAIASCIAIWVYITGFRSQRTFNRWIASQEIQQETGDKEKQLRSLSGVISNLQSQINNDVPREAERIYLSNRLDSIASSLGEQYGEYKKISARLGALSADMKDRTLEKPILNSIERAVIPSYKVRERRDRQARVLLIIVLILLVMPSSFSPNTLIDDEFIIAFAPGVVSRTIVFWASLIVSIILAIIMRWIGVRWVIPAVAKTQHARAVRISATVLSIVVLSGLAIVLGHDAKYYNASSSSNPQLNIAVGVTWFTAIFLTSLLLAALWSGVTRFIPAIQSRPPSS